MTQIAGATAGLILLFAEGPSRRATMVVLVTLLVAIASRGFLGGKLKKR